MKISKDQIDGFFNELVKTDIIDNNLKKDIIDNTPKQKTNIMFIVTACNFDCDYCYQRDDRKRNKNEVMTELDVDKFLADVCLREPDVCSTVVIFGGEPFLNERVVYYTIKKAYEIFKTTGKVIALNLITNGYYFYNIKNVIKFKKALMDSPLEFLLEISYDVSGQDRRVLLNGESSKKYIQKAINNLINSHVKIGIRYTIHKDNEHNVVSDLVKIQEFFKNTNLLERITLSFNYQEIQITAEQLKPFGHVMFQKYSIPICSINCDMCRKCNFEDFQGIKYQMKDTDLIVDGNQPKFNHFSINSSKH